MKKLLYVAPLALTLILSSCGSKDGDKKDGEKETKKMESGCDCMELMVDEIKKLEDKSKMSELESKLNKDYPECNTLTEEMFKGSMEDAAKECPAVTELMNLMMEMTPESEIIEDTLSMEEPMDAEEVVE